MTPANDHHHRVQNTAETRKHQQYLKDIVLPGFAATSRVATDESACWILFNGGLC